MTPSDLPNPSTAPREFLTHLYRAAVQRALPLAKTPSRDGPDTDRSQSSEPSADHWRVAQLVRP